MSLVTFYFAFVFVLSGLIGVRQEEWGEGLTPPLPLMEAPSGTLAYHKLVQSLARSLHSDFCCCREGNRLFVSLPAGWQTAGLTVAVIPSPLNFLQLIKGKKYNNHSWQQITTELPYILWDEILHELRLMSSAQLLETSALCKNLSGSLYSSTSNEKHVHLNKKYKIKLKCMFFPNSHRAAISWFTFSFFWNPHNPVVWQKERIPVVVESRHIFRHMIRM